MSARIAGRENNGQRLFQIPRGSDCVDNVRYTKEFCTRRTWRSPPEHTGDLPRSMSIQKLA